MQMRPVAIACEFPAVVGRFCRQIDQDVFYAVSDSTVWGVILHVNHVQPVASVTTMVVDIVSSVVQEKYPPVHVMRA
jgi:hypothetical protein